MLLTHHADFFHSFAWQHVSSCHWAIRTHLPGCKSGSMHCSSEPSSLNWTMRCSYSFSFGRKTSSQYFMTSSCSWPSIYTSLCSICWLQPSFINHRHAIRSQRGFLRMRLRDGRIVSLRPCWKTAGVIEPTFVLSARCVWWFLWPHPLVTTALSCFLHAVLSEVAQKSCSGVQVLVFNVQTMGWTGLHQTTD